MRSDDSQLSRRSRFQRLRERQRDRKQRREWRRERRRGVANPYDAANRAEGSLYKGGFFKKK